MGFELEAGESTKLLSLERSESMALSLVRSSLDFLRIGVLTDLAFWVSRLTDRRASALARSIRLALTCGIGVSTGEPGGGCGCN